MMDIFNARILCNKCGLEMSKIEMEKNGIKVRAVECPRCHERIIHPEDKQNLEHFKDLKGKTYNVKLRIVGNSHTVSIPKEIVNFMEEMNRFNGMHSRMRKHFEEMDNMVQLCFEDMGKISLNFGQEVYDEEDESLNQEDDDKRSEGDARRIALRRIKLKKKKENGRQSK